jgi:calcineurin-like phosphoesterase family protein
MAIKGLYDCFNQWHLCGGTVWIISDTHFGDKELQKGIPNRPNDEELVKLINSKVGRKDTLIILGDIGDISYVRQLRGYKVLIAGNHDKGLSQYKRERIVLPIYQKECATKQEAIALAKNRYNNYNVVACDNNIYSEFFPSLDRWNITLDNGLFDEVYSGPLMVGEKLLFSHERVEVPWAFNIHGHDHKFASTDPFHLNVCSDVIGYLPVNLNRLMKNGLTSQVQSIHRETINKATIRKRKREKKSKNV